MSQHLIHRQILNLRYSNLEQAKSDLEIWKQRNEHLILPAILEVLDELEIPGKTVRIPKLEIDLGTLYGKFDSDGLKKKLKELLRDKILADSPELKSWQLEKKYIIESNRLLSDEERAVELLLFLLEKGRKPWWAIPSQKSGIQFLSIKLQEEENPVWKNWLLNGNAPTNSLERLANHLDYREILSLIFWGFPEKKESILSYLEKWRFGLVPEVLSIAEFHRKIVESLVLAAFSKEAPSKKRFQKALRDYIFSPSTKPTQNITSTITMLARFVEELTLEGSNEVVLQKVLNKWIQNSREVGISQMEIKKYLPAKDYSAIFNNSPILDEEVTSQILNEKQIKLPRRQVEMELEKDESIPISNAGLILTGAFLPHFFKDLGLVDHKNFVSESAQNRAALILEYLLKKEEKFEESELLLNKILCGIEPNRPIPVIFSPTEKEIECCQNLLDSMVTHWSALKSTSGKTMAKSFFPREGLLKKTDRGYSLYINRLPIDILLNRLPWTISILKLSWMQETLFTEW